MLKILGMFIHSLIKFLTLYVDCRFNILFIVKYNMCYEIPKKEHNMLFVILFLSCLE